MVAWLALLLVGRAGGGFSPGRVPPGRFEYSGPNRWEEAPSSRWVVPLVAREACEEDTLCGGFTFQGVELGVEQQVAPPTTPRLHHPHPAGLVLPLHPHGGAAGGREDLLGLDLLHRGEV